MDRHTAAYVAWVADHMVHDTDSRPECVEFDLSQVTGVDQSGFASLVDVAVGATRAGVAITVRCGAKRVLLKQHRAGRVMTAEQLGRLLRPFFRPLARRLRTQSVVTEGRVVRWYSESLTPRRA